MSDEAKDISKKLAILEEIAALISRSHQLQDTLDEICRLVTVQMDCDVCSIYLLDESGRNLILRATHGLNTQAVGKVMMAVEEGITGMAVEEMRPVAVTNAADHPRYKYFPETREEKFASLLASPIVEKGRPLGVINIQTREPREFSPDDTRVVATISTQVAVIVQNYRLLDAVYRHQVPLPAPAEMAAADEARESGRPKGSIARGIAASPGISMGRAVVIDHHELAQLFEVKEFADEPKAELRHFEDALERARGEIKDAELRIAERLSDEEAKIFSTHLMILEDEGFIGRIREEVESGRSALFAVRDVVGYYVRLFEEIQDPYIRDKIADIEDVGKRVMNALSRSADRLGRRGSEKEILVAHRVMPSDAIGMDARGMVGMVSGEGGMESHSSIIARSFEIPAVVGLESQLRLIRDGDFLIIDGSTGNVYVNPDKEVIREFRRARKDYNALKTRIEEGAQKRSATKDGTRVRLLANISIVADVKTATLNRAEGVGLYRTEFLFITRATFPTEEEQYKVYCQILRQMKGRQVVIRTLDAGGDKYMPQLEHPVEANSCLGWRSIRVSLDLVHVFKAQLRAILRAAMEGKAAILFPMITTLEELRRAKQVLEETKEDLLAEKITFDPRVPVGMMVEVPSAVLSLEHFLGEVDFFSVGTNDLTQYTLAVDRSNQRVARLYDPLHPAVLQLIDRTIRLGERARKPVTLCGELSAVPEALPILIGMGYRALSMAPTSLPVMRYAINDLDREQCERISRKALKLATAQEVRGYLREQLSRSKLADLIRAP